MSPDSRFGAFPLVSLCCLLVSAVLFRGCLALVCSLVRGLCRYAECRGLLWRLHPPRIIRRFIVDSGLIHADAQWDPETNAYAKLADAKSQPSRIDRVFIKSTQWLGRSVARSSPCCRLLSPRALAHVCKALRSRQLLLPPRRMTAWPIELRLLRSWPLFCHLAPA